MIKKGSASDETFAIVVLGRNFLDGNLNFEKIVKENIFPDEFVQTLNINLLTPVELRVSTSGMLLDINPERIMLTTSDASQKYPLRDYCLNLLSAFNLESKIKQVGFNFSRRIYCVDKNEWHRVGHKIMPKTIWKNIYKPSDDGDVNFGLFGYSVKIDDSKREYPGLTQIRISPMEDNSLEILVNEHLEYKEIDNENKLDLIFNVEWDSNLKKVNTLINDFEEEV